MNNSFLRATAVICFIIVFIALAVPPLFGGPIQTLQIENGRWYLYDHGKYREVSFGTLTFLLGLTGAGIAAFVAGSLSSIALFLRSKKTDRIVEQINSK